MSPVHRDQIDVYVDQQVRFRRPAIDPRPLSESGPAELHYPPRVLRVVTVVTIGIECLEDPCADASSHLSCGHPPVYGSRDDDVDIFDSGSGQHAQEDLERGLPDVRQFHHRQRQRNVVYRYGDLHPGLEQRPQRGHVLRMVDGVPDG